MSHHADAHADDGRLRALALDLAVAGDTTEASPHAAWARSLVAASPHAALGLQSVELSATWHATLAWCSMPLSPHGDLRWGVDVVEDVSLVAPCVRDSRLFVPPAEVLAACTGPALRPLRRFIASRYQVRLQTAPGIRMWLWPERAVLVSLRPDTVGGFLYAPTPDQRSSVLVEPGGWQVIRW